MSHSPFAVGGSESGWAFASGFESGSASGSTFKSALKGLDAQHHRAPRISCLKTRGGASSLALCLL